MANTEQLIDAILGALAEAQDACIADTWVFAQQQSCDHVAVVGALKSLEADSMTQSEVLSVTLWDLTAEGKSVSTDHN